MPNDIINRQFFEFTCEAEKAAKQVRHEIQTHTAMRINEIISSVFAQVSQSEDYLKIDKIEIDLGNVAVHDFGGKEMLTSFRESLQQQITAIQHGRARDSDNINNKALFLAPFQNELEMIRSFLLSGGLPWWVDKSIPLDIDSIIEKMVSRHPRELKQLLEEHITKPNVILRLFTQMKPVTVSKVTELIPGISDVVSKEIISYDATRASFDSLSPAQINGIKKIFTKLPQTPADKLRPLLVIRLLEFYKFVRANNIPVEQTDPGKLLLQLKATQLISLLSASYNTNLPKERSRKRELTRLVKNLTIFQAEILLFQLSFNFDTKHFTSNEAPTGDDLNSDDKAMTGNDFADEYTSFGLPGNITDAGNSATSPATNFNTEKVEIREATFTENQKEDFGETFHQSPQFSDSYKSADLNENQNNLPGNTSQEINSGQVNEGNDAGNITSDKPDEESRVSEKNGTGVDQTNNLTAPAEDYDRDSAKIVDLSESGENRESKNNTSEEGRFLADKKSESAGIGAAGEVAQQKRQGLAATATEEKTSRSDVENSLNPGEKGQLPGLTNQEETPALQTNQPDDEAMKNKPALKDYPKAAEKTERDQKHGQHYPEEEIDAKKQPSIIERVATEATDPASSKSLEKNHDVTSGVDGKTTGSVSENYLSKEQKERPGAVSGMSESNNAQNVQPEPAVIKMIAFIMNKLRTRDAVILHYLQRLDKKNLEHIAAIFKKHVRKDLEKRKIVTSLLGHPALVKNNMLKIFANLVPGKEKKSLLSPDSSTDNRRDKNKAPSEIVKKIQSSQTVFASYIKSLPIKDLLVIKEIFKKGSFESDGEKRLLKKTLLKLPEENILLMKFLAELPQQEIAQLMATVKQPSQSAGDNPEWQRPKQHNEEASQKILIENAGLCLIALYLPGFFKRLGYVENGMFKNKSLAIRAIYILQYITTGQIKSPEYLLQFNKLLCGFGIDDYITKSTRLTKNEILEAGNLLESVIKNWPVLKNTSPNGLRESFLKRKGILLESETKWTLQVEKKGYDVLLSKIPWGYGMIKFSWMEKLLEVEWT